VRQQEHATGDESFLAAGYRPSPPITTMPVDPTAGGQGVQRGACAVPYEILSAARALKLARWASAAATSCSMATISA